MILYHCHCKRITICQILNCFFHNCQRTWLAWTYLFPNVTTRMLPSTGTCTVLDSLSERKGLSNWSLLHSVDFKKSLTSWSTFLNCCPWYIKIAHECCPSRPKCPVFCKKNTTLFGGPYLIPLGHKATFTPIPNALVATTTRNRLSLVKFLKAVFFFFLGCFWMIQFYKFFYLRLLDSSVTRKL